MKEHNLNVQEELSHSEFDYRKDEYDTHMHLIPDRENSKLHAFLHTGEAGSGDVVKTTIEGVKFRNHFITGTGDFKEVGSWFLTYTQADNFLAFLNCLKWERSDFQYIAVEYYEESGKPMMEDTQFGEESLQFKYKTESGQSQQVMIDSIYKNNTQMMVNFD